LRKNFPMAYKYLHSYKDELAKRDKTKRSYSAWYAFGRTQALNLTGYKLLFPYIGESPYFVYTDLQDLLFYNGYAIISKSSADLLILQKILKSDIFWYYLKHSSKPYGNGFYSFGKNYIKQFGICELTPNEANMLASEDNRDKINMFLCKKYGISI
jgi:adenine-specific DNA-methyltransferase